MENQAEKNSTLAVAAITSFLGPFMISSINIALPAIQKEFSADAVLLSWIATSYLLAVAAALVPAGKIADIHGRKKAFIMGLAVFTATSFFCAMAGSMEMLIAMRVFQGIGSAMTVTTGMAILISVFPVNERGKAIGILVAAVYSGLSTGPFAGGLLTRYLGWRSVFLVMVPLGIFGLFLTVRYLKGEWADARGEKLDVMGSILYCLALVNLVYGSTHLPEMSALGMVLVGVICFAAFIKRELTISNPVFEVRLFTVNRVFAFSSLAALINYSATFAVTFLLSLYLQYIKGLPPQSAGMILIAQPVIQALFSPAAGRLSDRVEPRLIATAGMALTALGLFLLGLLGTNTPLDRVVGILILMGFGFALFSSPNMNAIMSSIEKKYYGIASGSVATMRLLGQMVSMAVATLVFAVYLGKNEIRPDTYPLFLQSARLCFMIFTATCVIGIGFSIYRGNLRQ